jgi:hypothetical protein
MEAAGLLFWYALPNLGPAAEDHVRPSGVWNQDILRTLLRTNGGALSPSGLTDRCPGRRGHSDKGAQRLLLQHGTVPRSIARRYHEPLAAVVTGASIA